MLKELSPQIFINAAGCKGDRYVRDEHATVYRHFIGDILYIGRTSAPLIALHASMDASELSYLWTHDLRALTPTIVRLQTHGMALSYLSLDHRLVARGGPVLDIISNGAKPSNAGENGCKGHLILRCFGDIVHPVHLSATYFRPVARSSRTVDILHAADAMSNGLYLKALLADIGAPSWALLTAAFSLFQCLSTSVKVPEDRYNKVDLIAFGDAFDEGDLNAVHCCTGSKLLANAVTKESPLTALVLNDSLNRGRHGRLEEWMTKYGHPLFPKLSCKN